MKTNTESTPTTNGEVDQGIWDFLMRIGWIYQVFSGIQIDILAAFRKLQDGTMAQASLCDHNCTKLVGGYDCPAARTRNPNILFKTVAPAERIIQWVQFGAEGLRSSRDTYLTGQFDAHCKRFEIPALQAAVLKKALLSKLIEVNLFGANPELHKEIIRIIRELKALGFRVNLTTTGRRFMRDAKFLEEFLADPPHVLALSLDDLTPEELKRLLGLDLNGLRRAWDAVPSDHGQDQKAIEAIFMAKLAMADSRFPLVLFNMVIHPGNVGVFAELVRLLEQAFPKIVINPYPRTDSIYGSADVFNERELASFEAFVDTSISRTLTGNWLVRRMQYHLSHKAAFQTWPNDPRRVASAIAGYGLWRCYEGGWRYLQIGSSPTVTTGDYAGGRNGCFWQRETVTDTEELAGSQQVYDYLNGGMQRLSKESKNRCPGCSMPRLQFDGINVEAGLDEEVIPAFLRLRKEHVGF